MVHTEERLHSGPHSSRATLGQQRDAYFDGIRGIAILAVLAVHWLAPYVPSFLGGYIGVDVFFVLSGFIITTILWRRPQGDSVRQDYVAFLRGRVRRLYPALLGLLAVGTALVVLVGEPVAPREAAISAAAGVTQTASFVLGLDMHAATPFGHMWSLSVEWMFYLLWPVVLFQAKRRGAAALTVAKWAVAAGAVLYVASLFTSSHWFYFGITSRAPQILAGCAVALWAISRERRPLLGGRTTDVLVCAALGAIALWTLFGVVEWSAAYRFVGYPIATLAAVVLIAAPTLSPVSRTRAVLSWRPLSTLGLVSYSVYLWHLLPIQLLDKDRLAVPIVVFMAIAVISTVAATWLSFRFLEKPFLRAPTVRIR